MNTLETPLCILNARSLDGWCSPGYMWGLPWWKH